MKHYSKPNNPNENIFLSVVIPAFNEEERISNTLTCIGAYLKKQNYTYEIIVVDDGSKDNLSNLIRDLETSGNRLKYLKNENNKGKGYSIRRGVLEAKGDLILFSDADLSTPIEEVEKLIPWFDKGYDIAIGSRGLPGSNIVEHQPFYRETMGRIFNLLVQFLVIKGIIDTQCGFKCFRRDVAHKIFPKQKLKGFSFDVEVLHIGSKMGYRIKEVPIVWYNSPKTRVNAFTDSLKMFMDLLRIRFNIL